MEFGRFLRGVYLDRFFPSDGPPEFEYVDAEGALRLLWPTLSQLRDRIVLVCDIAPDTAFDGEADMALAKLAETGDFAVWAELSAGAWAVLIDRLMWTASLLGEATVLEEEGIKMALPRDAPDNVRQMATLLWLLAGPGRTPPDQWRLRSPDERRGVLLNSPLSPQ